jgi:hypothetical protein
MNTLELYHIYKSTKINGTILNDTYKNENPIIEIIYKYEKFDGRTHTHHTRANSSYTTRPTPDNTALTHVSA